MARGQATTIWVYTTTAHCSNRIWLHIEYESTFSNQLKQVQKSQGGGVQALRYHDNLLQHLNVKYLQVHEGSYCYFSNYIKNMSNCNNSDNVCVCVCV